MRYTKNKPIERGWYWYVELGCTSGSLVFVSEHSGYSCLCVKVNPQGFATKSSFRPVAIMHGHWAGPVVQPEPPCEQHDTEEHV